MTCNALKKDFKLGGFDFVALYKLYGVTWLDAVTEPTVFIGCIGRTKFLILQCILGIFPVSALIWYIVEIGIDFLMFITGWGALLSATYAIYSICLNIKYFKHTTYKKETFPSSVKVFAGLQALTYVTNFLVILLYWTVLYSPGNELRSIQIVIHSVPSIYIFIDLFISKKPVSVKQCTIISIIFGVLYTVWTGIHYALGITNSYGCKCIYGILNWEDPVQAIVWVVLTTFVLLPMLSLLSWAAKISIIKHSCVCGSDVVSDAASEPQNKQSVSDETDGSKLASEIQMV